MIKTEIKNYLDYGRVLSIGNGIIEAYVTIDAGPRIIRFGYVNSQNFMCDNKGAAAPKDDQEFKSFFGTDKKWEILGGHRIWTSPERYPNTYYPDSTPVNYEITENGAIFTPAAETQNSIQKQLEIKMDKDDANMQVVMYVKNIGKLPQKFSVWGLSVAAKHGILIMPMNTKDTKLLPNCNISVWPYTNLNDSRLCFGRRYITLRQDTNIKQPLKLGFGLDNAVIYYCLGDEILRKAYETFHDTCNYPDNNCSFETYTCDTFTEIESLGPLKSVKPNETVSLTEHWSLHKKPCDVEFSNDESIERMLEKL